MSRALTLFFSLMTLVACGDEVVNPSAPEGTAPTTTTSEPPPKKPIRRSVETRNPFGGPPANLLVDGDFEVSISFEGSGEQLAWIAVASGGSAPAYLRGETGGLCKSGVHCAVLEDGSGLYGKGAAAKDVGVVASVWMKPPEGAACNIATAELIHCNFSGASATLAAVLPDPAEDGWCEYRGSLDTQDEALCMYISHTPVAKGPVLVDKAVVMPADGTSPTSKMSPMPMARRAKLAELSDWLRRRTPFGDPPNRVPTFGPR